MRSATSQTKRICFCFPSQGIFRSKFREAGEDSQTFCSRPDVSIKSTVDRSSTYRESEASSSIPISPSLGYQLNQIAAHCSPSFVIGLLRSWRGYANDVSSQRCVRAWILDVLLSSHELVSTASVRSAKHNAVLSASDLLRKHADNTISSVDLAPSPDHASNLRGDFRFWSTRAELICGAEPR